MNFSYLFDCMSIFFFKRKTAYEMRISDWSSDVCSSDLQCACRGRGRLREMAQRRGVALPCLRRMDFDKPEPIERPLQRGDRCEQVKCANCLCTGHVRMVDERRNGLHTEPAPIWVRRHPPPEPAAAPAARNSDVPGPNASR